MVIESRAIGRLAKGLQVKYRRTKTPAGSLRYGSAGRDFWVAGIGVRGDKIESVGVAGG